ncbi:MAG: hypothetical protein AAGF31_06145 [Planctomycetota bacterium]
MRNRCLRSVLTLALSAFGLVSSTHGQTLDPLDFASLGTLNLPAGDYTIDTDTLTIFDNTAPGVPLFTGVADDQNGQADYFNGVWDPVANPGQIGIPEIAVFTFDGIDLQPSANVTITGRRAIALLSHGDATIGTPLSVDAEFLSMPERGVGGPGGFDGGSSFDIGGTADLLAPGGGPGGGLPLPNIFNDTLPSGNGGFGGKGRALLSPDDSALQGPSYGDLSAALQGGSGAANTSLISRGFAGGGGGGAIEINATESLRIDATISARGGDGRDSFYPGGSGGGVRLIGTDVAIDAAVIAIGGGLGGGGGRVYVDGLVDSVGLTLGEPTLVATAGIDVGSNHLDEDGTFLITASLDNVGVITLNPVTTLVAAGESIALGQSEPIAAPTDTVNYEIVVRDARFQSGATGTIEAGGYTSRHAIELAGETATLAGAGTLTNENQITGTGRVEVPTINAVGGTINATLDQLTFTQALINEAGGEVNAINSTLAFDGGLTSAGQINLINSTVNGDVVNDGVTSLAGANTFTGTVSGNGVFTGTGTGAFAGVLAPGNSPGLLTFEGDLELGSTATLEIEIAGTTPGDEHDRIEVGGFAALEGSLDVTLLDGFIPELGDSFAFLFASGAFDASFAATNLPDLSAEGLSWELNPGGSTLFLEAVPALEGDYNLDGTVDAADYTVWRDGLGTTFTPSDYDVWVNNFGSTAPASLATVPEPPAMLLSLIAAAAAGSSLRARHGI